jgi:putative colanic acid biosynthesis glycosyltransferase
MLHSTSTKVEDNLMHDMTKAMRSPEVASKPFSIVTIVRNDSDALQMTARSIIEQKYRNFEWVIIDGASTDGTQAVINCLRAHADIVLSEPDNGIFDAMNKGLMLVSGEYVLFLNAGDMFASPEALQRVAMALDAASTRPAMIICAAEFRAKNDRYWVQAPRDMNHIWHSVPTSHQAMLVRSKLHKQFPFNPRLSVAADYDAIARMSLIDQSELLVDVILSRVWRGAESNSIRKPFAGIWDMAQTQRDVLKLSKVTITYSAVRRFIPLAAVRLLDMPVISSLAYGVIRLLRPRQIPEPR